MKRVVARAPNHLGDGVMALPAMHALASLGPLTIFAPPWGNDLYRDVEAEVVPRGFMGKADVAVLFAPSLRAAWEGRRARRRIGVAGDFRRWLLTDVVGRASNRADTYDALARRAGAACEGAPHYRARASDPEVEVARGHIGFNPLSASGQVREWPGFGELAEGWSLPVVFYGGPGEGDRLAAVAGEAHPKLVGLPLPELARALAHCRVFVSVDTGPAHFARACGVPTVVIHGSTTSERTGPAGAGAVEGPEIPCRPCYRQTCAHNLECMDIPQEQVRSVIDAMLEAPRG